MTDVTIRKSGRWTAVDYPEKDSKRLFSPETRIHEYFNDFRSEFKDLDKDSKALEDKVITFLKKILEESKRPRVESGLCFVCVKAKRELQALRESGVSTPRNNGSVSLFSSLTNYLLSFFTRYVPGMEISSDTETRRKSISKATMTLGDPTRPPKDAKFCDCDNYPEITQAELEKIIARISSDEKSS